MRNALASLTAFLALLAPGAAIADTTALTLLRSTCVSHNANAAAVVQDLTALDWRQLSDAERTQNAGYNVAAGFVMHWTTSQAWIAPDGNGVVVLGEGPLGQGAAHANFCLTAAAEPFRRQAREVRDWLGFERFQTWGPGGDIFAYIRDESGNFTDGAHVEDAVRDEAARTGRLGFIQVVGDGANSVINFSVIDPVEPPQ